MLSRNLTMILLIGTALSDSASDIFTNPDSGAATAAVSDVGVTRVKKDDGKVANLQLSALQDEFEDEVQELEPISQSHPSTVSKQSGTATAAVLNSIEVYKEIGRLLIHDPVALAVCVFSLAYLVYSALVGKKVQPEAPKGTPKPLHRAPRQRPEGSPADRQANWRSEPRPHFSPPPGLAAPRPYQTAKRNKSQIAIQVNQQLLRLETPAEVLDCALAYTGQTDIVNVVTAVHRCAKLGGRGRKEHGNDPRLRRLLDQLQDFLAQDQPIHLLTRAVGNTSWALAKMDACTQELHPVIDTMLMLFVKHSQDFKPEELMNAVWAFGELRRDSSDGQARALQAAKAAVECQHRFPEFTLQQVVYLTWALGRLSGISCVVADTEVRSGLAAYAQLMVGRLLPGLRSLTGKNLAMTAWGIAHLALKVHADDQMKALLAEIAEEALGRGLPTFAAGDLASIVWALSKSVVSHDALNAAFRQHLLAQGLAGHTNQDVANIISTYAGRAHQENDTEFFRLLFTAAESFAPSFTRMEKVTVHHSFAKVGAKLPELGM